MHTYGVVPFRIGTESIHSYGIKGNVIGAGSHKESDFEALYDVNDSLLTDSNDETLYAIKG